MTGSTWPIRMTASIGVSWPELAAAQQDQVAEQTAEGTRQLAASSTQLAEQLQGLVRQFKT